MAVAPNGIITMAYKVLQGFSNVQINLLHYTAVLQMQRIIDAEQYTIIIGCRADTANEITHFSSKHCVRKIYILDQYDAENGKIKRINGNEEDLMFYLMNEGLSYLHEQESKARESGDIGTADALNDDIQSLLEEMKNF